METLPDPIPFIVTDRSATTETRAYISPAGVRLEVWSRGTDAPILLGREAVKALAQIINQPPGGAR